MVYQENLLNSKLGVFGGSGFYSIENLKNVEEYTIETPFGKTSDNLRIGKLGNIEVVYPVWAENTLVQMGNWRLIQ